MVLPQHSIRKKDLYGQPLFYHFADRIVIETLLHEHRSLRYIADYLGFSKNNDFQ